MFYLFFPYLNSKSPGYEAIVIDPEEDSRICFELRYDVMGQVSTDGLNRRSTPQHKTMLRAPLYSSIRTTISSKILRGSKKSLSLRKMATYTITDTKLGPLGTAIQHDHKEVQTFIDY